MKKTKNRNELAIFEELRLKTFEERAAPKKSSLRRSKISAGLNKYNIPISWWGSSKYGRQFLEGKADTSDVVEYKRINVFEETSPRGSPKAWWKKNKDGKLEQVDKFGRNLELGRDKLNFIVKEWLRNEAIDVVSLEIRSMKSKAYKYNK